ncbi:hypothetical protein RFI_01825 [Reticulomyxa filosa]|uniref:Uncharacterized protein n=1 Tax=Reticulomyxa filosa TaxID=46433 RepID=X6PAT3_RETFI|nr:hypothetical protein RFI_01825 [Reticulomyxa filosa]|eukprot:ETO35238.1 hypothetical protein RFI_01825 [Reticulomyxa filosa]
MCSSSATDVAVWNTGDSAEGYQGYFVCSGQNTYTKVEFSVSPTCSYMQTVYAGLGGCALNSFGTRFYCDSEKALVELFLTNYPTRRMLATTTDVESSSSYLELSTEIEYSTSLATTGLPTTSLATTNAPLLCAGNLYCNAWVFSSTCKYIFTLIISENSQVPIYGKFDQCNLQPQTTVVDSDTTAVDSDTTAVDKHTTVVDKHTTTVVDKHTTVVDSSNSASSLFVVSNLIVAIVAVLSSLF